MDQLRDYADDRLVHGCVYCGADAETRDHVPSRVFLDPPFPENLPVVGACWKCNNGFSKDEEYLACLLECVIAGSTEPDLIRRPRIADRLRTKPALRARLEAAKLTYDGQTVFEAENDRVRNVLVKLARGHAVFELSQPCRQEPSSAWWCPLQTMDAAQLDDYDAAHVLGLFGEVGSRGFQRTMIIQATLMGPDGQPTIAGLVVNDWMDVQDERYRYLAIDTAEAVVIKIVIAEYLACEVTWAREDL